MNDSPRPWYRKAVFYELYVRAFCDQNGDGHGDLRGATSKLDYLKRLGVDCVWLLSLYSSPLRDDGYDISDYYQIHPQYGTLDDLKEFLAQAPVVLVFCAHGARSAGRYSERGANLYAVQDASIACTYAMLAATALGLSTVWVGAFDEQRVREVVGASSAERPVSMLPLGYAAGPSRNRPRRSLQDLVHSLS